MTRTVGIFQSVCLQHVFDPKAFYCEWVSVYLLLVFSVREAGFMLNQDPDRRTAELQQIQQRLESQVLETRASLVRAARQAEVEALEAELEDRLAQLDHAHRSALPSRPRRSMVGSPACCWCQWLPQGSHTTEEIDFIALTKHTKIFGRSVLNIAISSAAHLCAFL